MTAYKEYMQHSQPSKIEEVFFSRSVQTHRGALFRHLANADVPLPSEAKGYIMMRDAKIVASSWDAVQTLTRTSYKLEDIFEALNREELPTPGHGGRATTHLGAFTSAGVEGYANLPSPSALDFISEVQHS